MEHEMTDNPEKDLKKSDQSEKSASRIIAFLALYLAPVLFLYFIIAQWLAFELPKGATGVGHRWISISIQVLSEEILRNHFAAVVGLPMAAIFALWVVTILRSKSGPIEFDAFGFRLRGASGPVVLWVLCFLAISFAIKLLW